MSTRRAYTSPYTQTPDAVPKRVQLTERDIEIILGLHRYRLLSAEQIEARYFPPGREATKPRSTKSSCQNRLKLLFHQGYIERLLLPSIPGFGRPSFNYVLDRRGADLVAAQLEVDREQVGWKPKHNQLGPLFIDHALAINNLRVVLDCLVRDGKLTAVHWIDEVKLKSAEMKDRVPFQIVGARKQRTYPDGYCAVTFPHQEQQTHFFIEIDQGTMTNTRWQGKIKAYQHFRHSGLSEAYYQTQRFRLLTVTTSQRRLTNLKKATQAVTDTDPRGDGRYFWFTTQDQVDIWQPAIILEPIWGVVNREQRYSLTG